MPSETLHQLDRLLGHVPRPGFHSSGPDEPTVTFDADGLRYTGERQKTDEPPVLAVGNSYTYGEEVSDLETWPAQLQGLSSHRVLNGGVTGYGFDQIVLRTEQLVRTHKPSLVIASFIEDDIRRTEMRCLWWTNKPWFAIEDSQLVLKGVPVQDQSRLPRALRQKLEPVVIKLPEILKEVVGYHRRAHFPGTGLAITRRLVERLAALQVEHGAKVVVMAQYDRLAWIAPFAGRRRRTTKAILDCALANGLVVVDTFQRFQAEPDPKKFYKKTHLTARGNFAVASLLAARLPDLLRGPSLS